MFLLLTVVGCLKSDLKCSYKWAFYHLPPADTRLLTPTCRYSTWRSLINGTTERAGLQSETFVFIEEAAKPWARSRELAAAASHAQKRERVLASASAH